jgi:hypothetical protein
LIAETNNGLGAAGWEPIPHAHLSETDAWCERPGYAQHGYFFAIRNPGKAREITLTLDVKALSVTKADFQVVTGCTIVHADAHSVRLSLPAQWTAVISVNRVEAGALAADHKRELKAFHTQPQ